MAQSKKKAEYAPPASQVDLEERLENENKSSRVLSTADVFEVDEEDTGRDFRVEDNDTENYVGTSPEYATYANETEAPLPTEEGPEATVFENFAAQQDLEEPEFDEEEEEEEPEEEPASDPANKADGVS